MSLSTTTGQFFTHIGIATSPGSFVLSSCRSDPLDPKAATTCPGVSASNNKLSWTWPPNMLASFSSGLVWWNLTLQRSTIANNRPNSLVVYDVGSNRAPAADPNWTTIKQWSSLAAYQADNPNPTGTFTDPWVQSAIVNYRLISNVGKPGDPVLPPFGEMTWNTTTVCPVQPLTASGYDSQGHRLVDGSGNPLTRLSWGIPFPYISGWQRCPTGCPPCNSTPETGHYAIFWVQSSSAVKSVSYYNVFKSYDGVHFVNATTIPAPFVSPWCDGDGAHNLAYYFQAVYSDGTLVNSNAINVNY